MPAAVSTLMAAATHRHVRVLPRSSTANFERMDGYVDQLRQLQDFLLPSDADLGSQIGRFFEALGDVGSAPGDLAPRVVALEEGKALAANFRSTANILELTSILMSFFTAQGSNIKTFYF